jgi:hypothetical protein
LVCKCSPSIGELRKLNISWNGGVVSSWKVLKSDGFGSYPIVEIFRGGGPVILDAVLRLRSLIINAKFIEPLPLKSQLLGHYKAISH